MVLSAFFYAYGLAQVPSGWLADRFGARGMMTSYVALWSVFTAFTGLATGLVTLLIARIGCGLAQAGAYPASGGLLSRWIPFNRRGVASSVVPFGGRIGGATAPFLTAWLIVGGAGWAGFGSWRPVLVVYGAAGVMVAWYFWVMFRDRPQDHPRCNAAERELIEAGRPTAAQAAGTCAARLPFKQLLTNRSMWLMCISQLYTNIGWAFLVTWLPTYLVEVKKVSPLEGGRMATTALLVGMSGILIGGLITDGATRRLGLRWGRGVPLAASRFLAGSAYLASLWLDSAWAVTAAFAMVSLATDLGLPSTWAFMQDVGGKHVGSMLGWANMWGSFGAAATAGLIPCIVQNWDLNHDWHAALCVCAGSFFVAGFAALGINASVPITAQDSDPDRSP